jgi:eukaryotic-like serine/threonine-protein kinase
MYKILLSFFIITQVTTISGQPLKSNPPARTDIKLFALGSTRWTFKTDGKIFASPTLVNDVLFIGSEDQNLYAINSHTGKLKWKFKTAGAIHSTVTAQDDMICFGSFDGNYYALNANTGKKLWSFKTNGEKWMGGKSYWGMKPDSLFMDDPWEFYLSTPIIKKIANDTFVFFGSSDGNLYALNAKTGMLKWKFKAQGIIHSSPAFDDNTLYVGSWDTFLYALNAQTGDLKWKFKTGEQVAMTGIQASAIVDHGMVYFGARDAHFYALNASTGELKWKFFADNAWVLSTAASRDSTLYFGTSDSFLMVALDAFTGKLKWKTQLDGYVFSSPILHEKNIFVGDFTGKIYSLDASNGHIVNVFTTPGNRQLAGSLLNNNKLDFAKLASGKDLNLYASTVFVMDELYKLGPIVSSPAVHNETLYVGSADGNVYAIELTKSF